MSRKTESVIVAATVAPVTTKPRTIATIKRRAHVKAARLCNREAIRCKVAGDWQRANTWRMGRQENMRKAREA